MLVATLAATAETTPRSAAPHGVVDAGVVVIGGVAARGVATPPIATGRPRPSVAASPRARRSGRNRAGARMGTFSLTDSPVDHRQRHERIGEPAWPGREYA